VDAEGELLLPVPGRCPQGADGSPCDVRAHARRERKTGPEHVLAVCRCHAHRVSFTIYPPGHVPYGRIAIVAADSEGRRIRGDALALTVFSAVFETTDRDGGAREGAVHVPRVHRRTRGRRLGLCAALVGIAGLVTDPVRGRIADALSVPALLLREAAQAYSASCSMHERASVIRSVLVSVALATRRIGLLAAGYFARLWGRPHHWDSVGQVLRPRV